MKKIIAIIILIAVSFFYWFGIRPESIRKQCLVEARKRADQIAEMEMNVENRGLSITRKADYEKVRDDRFGQCILEHGLNK